MGHYDDCYASDDHSKMTDKEKEISFKKFDAEIKAKGQVHGYFDDVGGYLIAEWAKKRGYATTVFSRTITVEVDPLFVAAVNAVKE